MRLTDSITSNMPRYHPADGQEGIGVDWWPACGNGKGGNEQDAFLNNPDGYGDGSHGTKQGDGHATHFEWHMMGGVQVILTLLEAWRNL